MNSIYSKPLNSESIHFPIFCLLFLNLRELLYNTIDLHHRWKMFEEETTGSSLLCGRKVGEIFQNIRFALLTTEQLADKFILVSLLLSREKSREILRNDR